MKYNRYADKSELPEVDGWYWIEFYEPANKYDSKSPYMVAHWNIKTHFSQRFSYKGPIKYIHGPIPEPE